MGFANRLLLCIFHSVYRFISKNYDVNAPLWPSARRELLVFIALTPLARSNWTVQWNERIFSSDSSEKGWGITQRELPWSVVGSVGRVREARRFRFGSSRNARDAALGAHPAALEESLFDIKEFLKKADVDDSKDDDAGDVNFLRPENVKLIGVGADKFESDVLGDVGVGVGDWEVWKGFPEVPRLVTHGTAWKSAGAGSWKVAENIVHL